MNKRFLAVAIAWATLAAIFVPIGQGTAAASNHDACYTVSDSTDELYIYDTAADTLTLIGDNNVSVIEAITWDPINSVLYAMNAGQLGTLNTSDGSFTAVGPNNSIDADGMAYDPYSGTIFIAIRRDDGSAPGQFDDLATIDAAGNVTIIGAIQTPVNGTTTLWDIDDLAIHPGTGQLYGVANAGAPDVLIEIDKATGAVTSSVGAFGPTDVEGLSWDITGSLRATTGAGANLYDVDASTGAATLITNFADGGDYESLACFSTAPTPPPNVISGIVFEDLDNNATFNGSDVLYAGATVDLYRDTNGDGLLDAGDIWVASLATDGGGAYNFLMSTTGAYVVAVDSSTLPAGSSLTTADEYSVDFGATYGNTDSSGEFGYRFETAFPEIDIQKTGPTTANVGDSITYTYTVTQDTVAGDGSDITTVSVTDADAAVTGITLTGGDDGDGILETGETWTYTGTRVITATDPDILNTLATVNGLDLDGDAVTDTNNHPVAIEFAPVLAVVKSGPTTADVGDTVTYTFSVTNDATGDGSPISNVSVTDNVAGAATYDSGDTNTNNLLETGETWIYEATYTVLATDPTTLTNTVSVTGQDPDGDPVGPATDNHDTTITYNPVIDIQKTVDNSPHNWSTVTLHLHRVPRHQPRDGS